MYGEYVFVCQSLLSGNKHDVLLDKKNLDVMGIDTIYDNIISDESLDEDEYSFDANEFLDLNENTDPDMVLKFQDRQA